MSLLLSSLCGFVAGLAFAFGLRYFSPPLFRRMFVLFGVVIPDLTATRCCSNGDWVLVKGELDGSSQGDTVIAVYAKAMATTAPVDDMPNPADKMHDYSGLNEREDYELVVPHGTQTAGKIVVWGAFQSFSHEVHSYDCSGGGTSTASTPCATTSSMPTTPMPSTPMPTTLMPTTSAPTTSAPTTSAPTTSMPTLPPPDVN